MPEMLDLIDRNRKPLGIVWQRGKAFPKGTYHLAVNVWVYSRRSNRVLITKRSHKKDRYPLMWEVTTGSVLAGETSIRAAVREVKEEVGIDLNPKLGRVIYTETIDRRKTIFDVWLFEYDGDEKIKMQEDEVCEAKWVEIDEIAQKIEDGKFVKRILCPEIFEILKKL